MGDTGIQRKIDDLGRVVIPRSMRKQLGIIDGVTSLNISLVNDAIVVRVQEDTLEDKIKDILDNDNNDTEKIQLIKTYIKTRG